MAYNVKVPDFEGPLDLLLHLIRKDALDIYTISVSQIADQYHQYVEMMQALNLDRAGDFLVMAATLAYHKSKMLLPKSDDEEEDDGEGYESLEELHRRLIEYQRYKEAAQELDARDRLYRDVYRARVQWDRKSFVPEEIQIEGSLMDLLRVFNRMLKKIPKESVHEVIPERVRTIDRIVEVMEILLENPSLGLEDLVGQNPTREHVIVTFLSILELVRMQMVRAYQFQPFGAIQLRLTGDDEDRARKLKESLHEYES